MLKLKDFDLVSKAATQKHEASPAIMRIMNKLDKNVPHFLAGFYDPEIERPRTVCGGTNERPKRRASSS
jgi:hypothetical protein